MQDGLNHSPIHGHIDPSLFYPSPAHEEALARLHYLVEQHLRLGVLLGDAGSGKSMLLAKLADDLSSVDRHLAKISMLGLSAGEFLFELATQLDASPAAGASDIQLWRAIGDRLKQYRYEQHSIVVLLDDAHEGTEQTMAAVCRLTEIDACEEARLTILMAAQSNAMGKLPARLLERASLRIDVEPWEREDTLEFLTHAVEQLRALDATGDAPLEAFSDAAVDKLHELSGGIPRRVGQLAQWALLAGAGLGLEQVDDETVASAAEELGVCSG